MPARLVERRWAQWRGAYDFDASPALVDDEIYLRGFRYLYRNFAVNRAA